MGDAPFSRPERFSKTASICYCFAPSLGCPWAPFGLPFGSLWLPLGSLLAPFGTLWLPLGSLGAVFGPPKHLIASGLKWYILFGSLWLPLGFLLAPSGSLLGSIPSQDLLQKTASIPSLAAFCHRTQVVHPVKTLRRLKWYILSKRLGNGSEISLRSCRDSAENVPRTSKNQPRTRRMNFKQSCLSHCDFFEWTATPTNTLTKTPGITVGRRSPPWGSSIE